MPYSLGPIASDTMFGGAATLSPGAGASICALTLLNTGIYQFQITMSLTGTAETQLNNATVTVPRSPSPLVVAIPTVTGAPFTFDVPRIAVTTTGLFVVKAVAAATAGAIYETFLVATRIG